MTEQPTPSPTPQPVSGHWAGFVTDLESIAVSLRDHLAALEGEARTRADGALQFLEQRLQDARNWVDAHNGLSTVSAPDQHVPSNLSQAPERPPQQAQEHPGDVDVRSSRHLLATSGTVADGRDSSRVGQDAPTGAVTETAPGEPKSTRRR